MPRWLQITLHVLAAAAGAVISYHSGTPLPSVVASVVQVAIGGIAQTYNTDGTRQEAPFVPRSK